MPTPAQMCCAAKICCNEEAAKVAQQEIVAEFEAAKADSPKMDVYDVIAGLAKAMKRPHGDDHESDGA